MLKQIQETINMNKRLLTREEEIELGKKKDQGDKKAREKLINSNLRLVLDIAKKVYSKYNTMIDNSFDDLVQDGIYGLIKAVDKYDWTKGTKFSTLATMYIQLYIIEGINSTGRTIVIPTQKFTQIKQVQEALIVLQEEKGRSPDVEEIYEYLRKEGAMTRVSLSLTEEKQKEAIKDSLNFLNSFVTFSLNQPEGASHGGNEDDTELGDTIPDDNIDINQYVSTNSIHDLIMSSLESPSLGERERTLIKIRYGLETGENGTYDDVCKIYGVSRQRMQQIEVVALEKLKCILIGKVITKEIQKEVYPFLTPDEKKMMSYRFGLNGRRARTISSMTKILNKNSEEVIHIERNLLKKLKPYFVVGQEN
jgi:RNA polymerase primary sigma factor